MKAVSSQFSKYCLNTETSLIANVDNFPSIRSRVLRETALNHIPICILVVICCLCVIRTCACIGVSHVDRVRLSKRSQLPFQESKPEEQKKLLVRVLGRCVCHDQLFMDILLGFGRSSTKQSTRRRQPVYNCASTTSYYALSGAESIHAKKVLQLSQLGESLPAQKSPELRAICIQYRATRD